MLIVTNAFCRPLVACLAILTLFSAPSAFAQTTGRLYGVVSDESNGEHIIGINVLVVGTTFGASTDIDGKYNIVKIPAGTYDVRVSGVGYAPKTVRAVNVAEGSALELNLQVAEAAVSVNEVVVEANAVHSSESAILSDRKRNVSISDGVSAEQIKRAPDATSGDALKRVTGLSIVENKFVYVRGITDRYNSTTLDGASVTSTEAGKKSFSFDMIPANLLENTSVIKSATPDLPGDFSGGLVQLNTLDFPSTRVMKLNLGSSYNSLTTSKGFLRSQGGSNDWLGFDDGSRKYPGDSPNPNDIAKASANNWAPQQHTAPANASLSLSLGDYVNLGDDPSDGQLGYIAALSYKNAFQHNEILVDDRDLSRYNTGAKDNMSILWGGIANLSYKFGGKNKVSFKNSFNQSASDEITRFNSQDNAVNLLNQYTIVDWSQRSSYTGQLTGEHSIASLGGLGVQWRASVSASRSQDPDKKEVTYYQSMDDPTSPFYAAINRRSWSHMNDRIYTLGNDFTLPLSSFKVRFGSFLESRATNYGVRYFNVTPQYNYPNSQADSLAQLPLDVIYSPQNFGPGKFLFTESSHASDSYIGEQKIYAGYIMTDVPFMLLGTPGRLVGGVRAENARIDVRVPRTLTVNGPEDSTLLKKVDLLPSFNLTFSVLQNANLRFAYSHSVNRPEFRELASTGFYDFVKYELEGGNPALKRSFIHNYDVRLELFPDIGELFAVSYFRKSISNAIEEQLIETSTRTRTWFNSPSASNDGWEFEVRKSLKFVSDYMGNFSVMANYTRIRSSVEVLTTVGNSSATRTYVTTRPLQGQSPYMINLSLLFTEPKVGTSVSILYNKFGRRLDAVGFETSDVYEEPRDLVDLSLTQPLFERFEAKVSIKNLNGKNRILTRDGVLYYSTGAGSTYALSFSVGL